MKEKIGIITDCVCDVPDEWLADHNIDVVKFYLHVGQWCFVDGYEITAANVIEHYSEVGTKVISSQASVDDYKNLYEKELQKYEEVIHFTISDRISESYKRASEGREILGESASHIHIVDTMTLSTGIGHLLILAASMRDEGKTVSEIVEAARQMIPRIDVSFITPDAHYLVINERLAPSVDKICKFFRLRPIFKMADGYLRPSGFGYGNREGYIKRYIRHKLRHSKKIDTRNAFLTHAACSREEIDEVLELIKETIDFENIIVTETSATVTCNCGEGAMGIIFVNK